MKSFKRSTDFCSLSLTSSGNGSSPVEELQWESFRKPEETPLQYKQHPSRSFVRTLEDVSLMNAGAFLTTGLSMESLLKAADTETVANSNFHQHILKDVLVSY